MGKRPPIMIGGKKLHECRIDEIVDVASHPLRKRFDTTAVGPVYHNRAIISAFAGQVERTTSELIAKFPGNEEDWSEQFNALRAGEVLGWALQEGIVERVFVRGVVQQHLWRLVYAEQQFERIGRGPRQRAIRLHNAGDLQAENNRLWARELKTRERLRQKAIDKAKPRILDALARICRIAPDTDITAVKGLERFTLADIRTISACRELIIDEVAGMGAGDVDDLKWTLDRLCADVGGYAPRPGPIAPPAPAEALAELDGFIL